MHLECNTTACHRMNLISMEILYSFDHYTESWVEVSSRPSSSSLSSATADDVLPAGLREQVASNARRRRRPTRSELPPFAAPARGTSAAGSSQEEYEESESESDQIMTSSNEALRPHFPHEVGLPTAISSASEGASSEADEDDENSTALGVPTHEPAFTPQPNAFSHPPRSSPARIVPSPDAPNSYFPSPREAPPRSATRSYPPHRPRSHTPYNMIAPSHQTDHDAALRASLSTLLSCAAAARGLPKREQQSQRTRRPSIVHEPLSLRMVHESALMGEHVRARRTSARRNSAASSRMQSPGEKGKRKASTSKDRSETSKKQRGSGEEVLVTPTLMTWVVSAGVVVLFGAISFSAGYAIGREVGRMEAGMIPGSGFGGKDMGKGLKRLRWGSTSTMVRV